MFADAADDELDLPKSSPDGPTSKSFPDGPGPPGRRSRYTSFSDIGASKIAAEWFPDAHVHVPRQVSSQNFTIYE
jgi:hypothetical protein